MEEHYLFPYFAWGSVLVGALAVMNLALHVQLVGKDLSDRTAENLSGFEAVGDEAAP